MNDEVRTKPATLVVGGQVAAVVPQSIEELWRVSKMVVAAGLAPKALVGKKVGDDAASAVSIAIMAGAELGLPPMVSLRSFTVIGGRPALYGDGLINVCRRSKKAAYIRTGYDADAKVGWCEAKRSDTDEVKRTTFSIAEAKRAGLWDERDKAPKWDYDQKKSVEATNEAPWHRYPERMLAWRAAGYCLRELFADVLGGMTDEWEAREIAGPDNARDITPQQRLEPPEVPTDIPDDEASHGPSDAQETAAEDLLAEIEAKLAKAIDEDDATQMWDELSVEAKLSGNDDALSRAFVIRNDRLAALK